MVSIPPNLIPSALIPSALIDATVRREGDAGRRWVEDLPALGARYLDRWGCEPDGAPWHGEVALVLPVRRASGPAVLKVSFPYPGSRGEVAALRRFDGHGAVRLLDADEEAYVMLLERAGPETLDSLASAEDAIEVAGDLARRLTIRELGSDPTTTLMHADLHFGNVLAAAREPWLASVREPWLAIDPKGWRGTAAYAATPRRPALTPISRSPAVRLAPPVRTCINGSTRGRGSTWSSCAS